MSELGDKSAARIAFGRAIEIDPASADARNDFGVFLFRSDETDRAIEELMEAVRLDAELAPSSTRTSGAPSARRRCGRRPSASSPKPTRLAPNETSVWTALGQIRAEREEARRGRHRLRDRARPRSSERGGRGRPLRRPRRAGKARRRRSRARRRPSRTTRSRRSSGTTSASCASSAATTPRASRRSRRRFRSTERSTRRRRTSRARPSCWPSTRRPPKARAARSGDLLAALALVSPHERDPAFRTRLHRRDRGLEGRGAWPRCAPTTDG